jgi:uncharacterized protein (TIGR02145 family)
MKTQYIFLMLLVFTIISIHAQSPEKMSYQAVIRDAGNKILSGQTVSIRISILQGFTSGTEVYKETYNPKPQTNANGLVTVEIGSGIPETGIFENIDWSNGPYFIKIETDPTGNTNYSIIGTSQLLSVPYALYAKKAENGFSGNYDDLKNKPFLFDGSYTSLVNKPEIFDGQYSSLSGKPAFATVASTGNYSDLINKPIIFNGSYSDLTGKPTLAKVASTGSYNDLTDKPTNFSGVYSDLTGKPTLAAIATSGSYSDLINKPSGTNLGDMLYWNGSDWVLIPVGKPGQILQISAKGLPSWSNGSIILPVISTDSVTSISVTTAVCGGEISNDGGSSVNSRGVCWSKNELPTIIDNKTIDGSGTGTFASKLTGLSANTKYYVRAYLTNSNGTFYGTSISFTTLQEGKTLVDIDGNEYKIDTIGTQIWMAENLKVTHYRNGDPIPNVTNDRQWNNLTAGAYCDNNNSPSNSKVYGRLYNYYTVVDPRNLCPIGWHVASDEEWSNLTKLLGGESIAGGKLKELGTTHWQSPNSGATNESGFTAIAAGSRLANGAFYLVGGMSTQWWSSTSHDAFSAYNRYVYNDYINVSRYFNSKNYGLSVRCLKD